MRPALSKLGSACALEQPAAADDCGGGGLGLLAAMVECTAAGSRCGGVVRTAGGRYEPRVPAGQTQHLWGQLGSSSSSSAAAAVGERAWVKAADHCLGRALFGVATDEQGP